MPVNPGCHTPYGSSFPGVLFGFSPYGDGVLGLPPFELSCTHLHPIQTHHTDEIGSADMQKNDGFTQMEMCRSFHHLYAQTILTASLKPSPTFDNGTAAHPLLNCSHLGLRSHTHTRARVRTASARLRMRTFLVLI
jgi:hypothetical protein